MNTNSSKCGLDGNSASIGKEANAQLVLDMGLGNEIISGPGYDFYFYEVLNKDGIDLDAVEVSVAEDQDGHPGDFKPVFVWGDDNPNNNGSLTSIPEQKNAHISSDKLFNKTGIGIDIGQSDGVRYRYVRIRSYPPDKVPEPGRRAQVDAIQRVNVSVSSVASVPSPTPSPTPTVTTSATPTATMSSTSSPSATTPPTSPTATSSDPPASPTVGTPTVTPSVSDSNTTR